MPEITSIPCAAKAAPSACVSGSDWILKRTSADQLKGQAVRGGAISVVAQGLKVVLQTGTIVTLARLLSPADYGLQGMALAMTGILGLFKDTGLSLATVQREVVTREQISAAFWLNLCLGALLTLSCAALAPVAVAFYREPRLFWIVLVSSVSFLVTATGIQHRALLQRNMRFLTIAKIDLTSLAASAGVGITMATLGFGYWALVAMGITEAIVSAAGAWYRVRWVPGRPRRGSDIWSLVRFGGNITCINMLVYLGNNAEKILLGRFWGVEALGLYGRAYSLINQPTSQLHASMFGVAFSALSRLQSEPKRLFSAFLRGYSAVLSLTVPATLLCALFADEIVRSLLGPKWLPAVPILRLLAPTILTFAFCNPLGWFLTSCGLLARNFKICLMMQPVIILGILLGIPYGPKGVALCYSAAWILLVVPIILWAIHGTGITARDCWQAAKPAIVSGVLAAGCGLGFKFAFENRLAPILYLFLGSGLTLGVYGWILLFAMRQRHLFADLIRPLYRRNLPQPGETNRPASLETAEVS